MAQTPPSHNPERKPLWDSNPFLVRRFQRDNKPPVGQQPAVQPAPVGQQPKPVGNLPQVVSLLLVDNPL